MRVFSVVSQAPSICETGKLSNISNKCVPHLEYCNSWALRLGSMQTWTENSVIFNTLLPLLHQGTLTEAKITFRNYSFAIILIKIPSTTHTPICTTKITTHSLDLKIKSLVLYVHCVSLPSVIFFI